MPPVEPKPRLQLVPPADDPAPARAQAGARVKRLPRAAGQLQCPRCGSREWLHVNAGGRMTLDGKVVESTSSARHICATCYKKGSSVSVLPAELKPV